MMEVSWRGRQSGSGAGQGPVAGVAGEELGSGLRGTTLYYTMVSVVCSVGLVLTGICECMAILSLAHQFAGCLACPLLQVIRQSRLQTCPLPYKEPFKLSPGIKLCLLPLLLLLLLLQRSRSSATPRPCQS